MNSQDFYRKTRVAEDIVRENFRFIVVILVGFIAAAEYGIISYPELPEGTGVILTGVAVAGLAGFVAAKKIDELLPSPEGIFIVEFEASSDTGGAVWELSQDQFEEMEVSNGSLFQWPTAAQTYEVREYRPEENVAVANWRESVAGSELAGDKRVPEAFASIEELRTEFEPEARKYRLLQRRIRKVARKLDRRRLRDQEALLDEHTTPSFDDDKDATVSGVLREELPDELLPDSMKPDEWDRDGTAGETNGTDTAPDSDEIEGVVEFDDLDEAITPRANNE